MGEIYEFADHKNKNESLLETEIKNEETLLKDSVWFHGNIERSEAETRILNNGEFLVRLSQAEESKFVVSTKWNGKFLHTIVKMIPASDKIGLLYFIDPKFRYPTVLELIKFHKENQYPLSENSEAVLYKPIDMNQIRNNGFSSLRESKFRKSMNPFRRHQHTDKKSRLPRSDSESHLVSSTISNSSDQFQDPLSLSRHSLTELHRATEPEPGVPHKPRKPSRHLLLKLRPSNLRIRNKKLYKEPGDYADYSQVRDTDNALLREQQRRGLSGSLNSSNRSPSLFGLNTRSSDTVATTPVSKKSISTLPRGRKQKKTSIDESVYVLAQPSNCDSSNHFDGDGADDDDNRDSTLTLRPRSNTIANEENGKFDVYGFDRVESEDIISPTYIVVTATRQLGLVGFLDLSLNTHRVTCLTLVDGPLDKTAINIAASRLLSDRDTDGPRLLAWYLLEELTRAFRIAASKVEWPPTAIGYRWAFLTGSSAFQRDLSIRQTALSHFIMATVVCTTSTEKRINLIFFWIKCAQYLLNHVQDMFHFMAIFSAIFSQQILSLRVWKLVYRQDPSAKLTMESLKEAIKKGCLFRTDIDCCIPDLVQLCNVFTGNEDDLNLVSRVCIDVATWPDQAFTSDSSWLMRITKELNTSSAVPFYRELVQTESLLCLILGKNSVAYSDVTPLIGKIDECITIMAKLVNDNHI